MESQKHHKVYYYYHHLNLIKNNIEILEKNEKLIKSNIRKIDRDILILHSSQKHIIFNMKQRAKDSNKAVLIYIYELKQYNKYIYF